MIKLSVLLGLCAAVMSVGAVGDANTTTAVEEKANGENEDNVAESSEFGSLYDLGSVSSGLLSTGVNFQSGFTPVTAPSSDTGHVSDEHEEVKTITVTKEVPVPYTVTVEKRVPVRVEVPVDKPYPVYVPRPYQVVVEKKIPYEVRVPVPKPYTVEKHVPVPVQVQVARPFPVQVDAPYPVYLVRKVPYTVEKRIPFPLRIPVLRPYPVHVKIEKHVPFPVEKTVRYPVQINVERPVPVPVEKPYPVHVEKHVPVPVEKIIPYPVKIPVRIPVKIPVPIPVVSHDSYKGSSSDNQYHIHGHQSDPNQQQEYHQQQQEYHQQQQEYHQQQYQHYHEQGEETKEHGNILISDPGALAHHEEPYGVYQVVGSGEQQQQFHYERIPAHQQPQVYGELQQQGINFYGEPQQQDNNLNGEHQLQATNLYIQSHESHVPHVNASYQSPVAQDGYLKHQDIRTSRNEKATDQRQLLSVQDFSKNVREQNLKQRQVEHGTEGNPGFNAEGQKHRSNKNKGPKDRSHKDKSNKDEGLKIDSDSGEGKQESYFKFNSSSSAYTSNIHHGSKTTG